MSFAQRNQCDLAARKGPLTSINTAISATSNQYCPMLNFYTVTTTSVRRPTLPTTAKVGDRPVVRGPAAITYQFAGG